MKICPKCQTEHSKNGTFCSRQCANSRTFSVESRKKKSIANKNYWTSLSDAERLNRINIAKQINQGKRVDRLFEADFIDLSYQSKRKRVIIEQLGKCNRCGIDKWLEEIITFELEHKDGNNKNNDRSNLEILCPNCHSLTSTWRGRKNKVSDEQLYCNELTKIYKNASVV